MRADFYKEYYHLERTHWWFLARKKILRDQIEKLFEGRTDLKVLNVGAALGASSQMLQKFGDVTSLEYNKDCCIFVKEVLQLDFIHGTVTDLPFQDNFFDLVCAFDVIEHVPEDALAVTEMHRVCKPGGFTFTTVPAFKFLWSEHDLINQHVRRYTMKSYLSLFRPRKCRIHFKSYFNFWLFTPIALFRMLSSGLRKNQDSRLAKSDNQRIRAGLFSKILLRIFKSESFILKKGIPFPIGVSLMVISQKE
jgi:ubiquinone/menaquinone biosynthesis C-methylase UbiE